MKLLIKQRVFAWTDTYDVYDEWENVRYFVKASMWQFGHQIHVIDRRTGAEAGGVFQKLLAFLPQFYLEVNGREMGSIRREFSFLRPRYTLDVNGWRVQGDVFGWDYDVVDGGGRYIMHISKEPFHWGDTYVLDIPDPRDEVLCLLIAIAIDAANCSNND